MKDLENDPLSTWPTPCNVGTKQTTINLSTLSATDKAAHWKTIKQNNAELAELLSSIASDDIAQEAIAFFDCTICIYADDIKEDGKR